MFKYVLTITVMAFIVIGCATNKPSFEVLPMGKVKPDAFIDMRGKKITTFILYNAVVKLKEMKAGEILEIITENYPPIESDISAWSRMTGHKIVALEKNVSYQRFYIKKGIAEEKKRKLAMVISHPGLEELLSPLGFALGGALGEMDVYIYFQGPAVEVLKKGFNEKLQGINSIFSGFAREGLAEIGHIPPQEKILQLKELGAHFYMCGPSMDHFGVKKSELIFDDVIVAEYLTFIEVMDKADIHIFLQ